jgi:hypothetical protein
VEVNVWQLAKEMVKTMEFAFSVTGLNEMCEIKKY